MTINEKLRRLFDTRNMAAVARIAGVGRTAVNKYCNASVTPRSDVALRLARALDVSVEWLIDDEQGWPPVYVNHKSPSEEQAA
ncbi:MAG: helix-turn-helix transcriptional regulator [Planctomycetota bacterium]